MTCLHICENLLYQLLTYQHLQIEFYVKLNLNRATFSERQNTVLLPDVNLYYLVRLNHEDIHTQTGNKKRMDQDN